MTERQLRKRKQVFVPHTPTILDDIFVCWDVDGMHRWWPALVLEVVNYDSVVGGQVGKGKLLYKKYKSYPPEEAAVEFVYTPRKGHLVVQVYNGKPLQMTWSHNQPQRQKDSVDTISVTPVSKHDPSTPIPIASNDNSIKLLKAPLSSSSSGIKVDPTNIITSGPTKDLEQRTILNERTDNIRGSESQQWVLQHAGGLPSSSFNAGQADALAQTTSVVIEQVMRSSQRYIEKFSNDTFHEQLTQLVTHELRTDLVNELHRHFKAPQSMQKFPTELQQRSVRICVSCPLHTFSTLAKNIYSSFNAYNVHFFPAFQQTQNPSISSERFTIYFPTVHELCKAIGFNDDRDFETLHFRERCQDGTYYTRIIGSLSPCALRQSLASLDKKGNSSLLSEKKTCTSTSAHAQTDTSLSQHHPLHQIEDVPGQMTDIIFVGLSLNSNIGNIHEATKPEVLDSATSSSHVAEIQSANVGKQLQSPPLASAPVKHSSCIALARKRALWDEEVGDFLSHWESFTTDINVAPPPSHFFHSKLKKLDGVFALRWEPKVTPRTNAWTADAVRSGTHVLGKLELFLPWVLLCGEQCVEVGDIISKHSFKMRS